MTGTLTLLIPLQFTQYIVLDIESTIMIIALRDGEVQ